MHFMFGSVALFYVWKCCVVLCFCFYENFNLDGKEKHASNVADSLVRLYMYGIVVVFDLFNDMSVDDTEFMQISMNGFSL